MFCRIRKWAKLWPGVVAVMASLALAASASGLGQTPEYVTMAEMERYFITKGLSFAAALLGGIWIMYGALERSREKREEVRANQEKERWDNISRAIEAMASNVSTLAAAIREHDEDEGAHFAASKLNHAPIHDTLHELRQGISDLKEGQAEFKIGLAELIAEHNIIRENECRILRNRNERTRREDPPNLDPKQLGRSEG